MEAALNTDTSIVSPPVVTGAQLVVGLSTSSIEPSLNNGIIDGIGHYTSDLVEGLEQRELGLVPYAFRPKAAGRSLEKSIAFPHSFSRMAMTALLSRGLVNRFSPDCDVFHSTDFKVLPMTVPVVATLWDAIPIVHPQWLASGKAQQLAPFVLKQLSKFADRIIVASNHAANDIELYFGIHADKIAVVPWGISNRWFERIPPVQRKNVLDKFGLRAGFFLAVGTIQPRKNYERLIEAHAQLSKAARAAHPLVIVGKFGWGERLKTRLLESVAKGDVIWLDDVNADEDVRALYQEAFAFVFPSLYEGFGIPVLEAFASKVPVIASDRTSVPELTGGKAIEIDPTIISNIVDAMVFLIEEKAIRDEFVQEGFDRAKIFTSELSISRTIKVYQSIL